MFFVLFLFYFLTNFYYVSQIPQPSSLTFDDFNLYVKQGGPNAGLKCLELLSKNTDKSHKLSLGNYSLRDEKGFHDQIEDPNDPLCIVYLFGCLRRHYPSDYTGTIFHHQLNEKKIKKLKMTRDSEGFMPMADLTSPFGKNYYNIVCKAVATRCGLDNPEKHTAASRRRSGITQLVSSDVVVPSSEIMISARHKSAITNAG